MNLAQLNHILIPSTKEGRDRLRQSAWGRVAKPLVWAYWSLSEEGRFLFLFAILLAFSGFNTSISNNLFFGCMTLTPVLVSILLRPLFTPRGLRVKVEAPRRVEVGAEVTFRITVYNDSNRAISAIRVERPLLSWDGRWIKRPAMIRNLEPQSSASVQAVATFSARGRHHLDSFNVACLVPPGLAQGARIASSGTRFAVVPKLIHPRQPVRPQTARVSASEVTNPQRGVSNEWLGVRPYLSGDRVKDLHARISARSGKPMVTEYQLESANRIALAMNLVGGSQRSFELALSLVYGFGVEALRSDCICQVFPLQNPSEMVEIGRGQGPIEELLDLLTDLEPSSRLEPEQFLTGVENRLKQVSSLILVSTGWSAVEEDLRRRLESRLEVKFFVVGSDPVPPGVELISPKVLEEQYATG